MAALTLPRGGTSLIVPREGSCFARLTVSKGVLRLSASYGESMEDVTLAFVGPGQPELVRLDPDRHYVLEAIVNSECELNYEVQAECEPELIASWLLSFHLIRHSLGSDQRLNRLLFFLAEQFGIASPIGFRIPFTLPHARFAEVIGSTRSTVTRQLVALRDQGRLTLSDAGPSMVLHNKPQEPNFWC